MKHLAEVCEKTASDDPGLLMTFVHSDGKKALLDGATEAAKKFVAEILADKPKELKKQKKKEKKKERKRAKKAAAADGIAVPAGKLLEAATKESAGSSLSEGPSVDRGLHPETKGNVTTTKTHTPASSAMEEVKNNSMLTGPVGPEPATAHSAPTFPQGESEAGIADLKAVLRGIKAKKKKEKEQAGKATMATGGANKHTKNQDRVTEVREKAGGASAPPRALQ